MKKQHLSFVLIIVAIVRSFVTLLGIASLLVIDFLASFLISDFNIIQISRCLLRLIYAFAAGAVLTFIISRLIEKKGY